MFFRIFCFFEKTNKPKKTRFLIFVCFFVFFVFFKNRSRPKQKKRKNVDPHHFTDFRMKNVLTLISIVNKCTHKIDNV